MSDYAIVALLLTITAFYVFLAIYILVHVISTRTPSLAKVNGKGRKASWLNESEDESDSRLW